MEHMKWNGGGSYFIFKNETERVHFIQYDDLMEDASATDAFPLNPKLDSAITTDACSSLSAQRKPLAAISVRSLIPTVTAASLALTSTFSPLRVVLCLCSEMPFFLECRRQQFAHSGTHGKDWIQLIRFLLHNPTLMHHPSAGVNDTMEFTDLCSIKGESPSLSLNPTNAILSSPSK